MNNVDIAQLMSIYIYTIYIHKYCTHTSRHRMYERTNAKKIKCCLCVMYRSVKDPMVPNNNNNVVLCVCEKISTLSLLFVL